MCSSAFALPVRFAVGPDNNQDLLLSHIQSAEETLTINIYLFDHPAVARAVINRIEAGVTVRLLVENQPFGAVTPDGKQTLTAIRYAMTKSRNPGHQLFLMTKTDPQIKRRYRYDHAKYVVVDGKRSLISSENFTATGHTNPGEVGNRGWDTVLDDTDIAAQLEDIFATDTETSHSDIKVVGPVNQATQLPAIPHGKHRNVAALEEGQGEATQAKLITSPESLDGLVAALRSAKTSISIQHMSLPTDWKAPNAGQNPIVTELIHAAQRGVNVRVILNDERVFAGGVSSDPGDDPPTDGSKPNQMTVSLLNSIGQNQGLQLAARIISIGRVGISYLHNKGMVVDGKRAIVSSINGSQTSVMKNREVAILLESPAAAQYYGGAFDFDWNASAASGPAKRAMALFDLISEPSF